MRFSIPDQYIGSKIDRVFFSLLLLLDYLFLIVVVVWCWVYAFTQDPTLTTVLDKSIAGVLITLVAFIIYWVASGIVWWIVVTLYGLARTLWILAYERWLA